MQQTHNAIASKVLTQTPKHVPIILVQRLQLVVTYLTLLQGRIMSNSLHNLNHQALEK